MNESESKELLDLAEAALRTIDGRDLFLQPVQDFSNILIEIIVSSEACALLETIREDLRSLLLEHKQPLDQLNEIRLHFTLGRLDFLLDSQKQARAHFLEAANVGLPSSMAYYNLAMTYAADIDMEANGRKELTMRYLQKIVDTEGASSEPAEDAASHIKLLEKSDFL